MNFARYESAGLPFSESRLGNLNQLATKCVFTEVYIYVYIHHLPGEYYGFITVVTLEKFFHSLSHQPSPSSHGHKSLNPPPCIFVAQKHAPCCTT